MYLKRVDIKGFRGINQLVLEIKPDEIVLIGENTWGKSSLLSALTLLSPQNMFYELNARDFYLDGCQIEGSATCYAELNFSFCENSEDQLNAEIYKQFDAVKYRDDNGLMHITYQIRAYANHKNSVVTERHFLSSTGEAYTNIYNEQVLVQSLIELRPVLRLKNPVNGELSSPTNQPLSQHYVQQLSQQLTEHAKQINSDELYMGLQAARALLEYYLVDSKKRYQVKSQLPLLDSPSSKNWDILDRFNHLLDDLDNDAIRFTLLGVFTALLTAKGDNKISPHAVPILLLEEPESQLHPIILSIAMHLLNNLPVQKIITTNSSDMVALSELDDIYRLIRYADHITVHHLTENAMSVSDARRIKFHIFYRRSSALFARTWLLVEGETEVWMLSELASQSGYHLNSEGVQIIEFAQCGLKPLIKFASLMGINWHVLTDGDSAGKKYADTVRSSVYQPNKINSKLTVLPAKDIENFMFRHGFSHIYKMAGYGTTQHIDLPVSRIIQKAIHKTSKPDLAVAVCDDARTRGAEVIPTLLKQMFERVVSLAKHQLRE